MSQNVDHEESKVQEAIELMQANPKLKASQAARQSRCSYSRLTRRLRGVPPSKFRGGHNRKLSTPENEALKDHLIMCHHRPTKQDFT